MEEFVLKAEPRTELGTRAARRLRRRGLLPANIYGHKEANAAVVIRKQDFMRFFEAGHRVAAIEFDGKAEHVVIKEVQYDAFGTTPVHVDFTRVSRFEKIEMEVPIETVGVPKGVAGGGVLDFPLREVTVRGPAMKIPERIELNIEDLAVGDAIRVKDVTPPEGCEILDNEELVIVAVHAAKAAPVEEAPAEAAPAEPELVRKEKPEEEAEGGEA